MPNTQHNSTQLNTFQLNLGPEDANTGHCNKWVLISSLFAITIVGCCVSSVIGWQLSIAIAIAMCAATYLQFIKVATFTPFANYNELKLKLDRTCTSLDHGRPCMSSVAK